MDITTKGVEEENIDAINNTLRRRSAVAEALGGRWWLSPDWLKWRAIVHLSRSPALKTPTGEVKE